MCPTRNFTPLTRMESYFYRFRGGRGVPGGRDRGTCRPANSGTIAQETIRPHRFLVWSDCDHIATPDPLLHIVHSFSEIQSNTGPPGGSGKDRRKVMICFWASRSSGQFSAALTQLSRGGFEPLQPSPNLYPTAVCCSFQAANCRVHCRRIAATRSGCSYAAR